MLNTFSFGIYFVVSMKDSIIKKTYMVNFEKNLYLSQFTIDCSDDHYQYPGHGCQIEDESLAVSIMTCVSSVCRYTIFGQYPCLMGKQSLSQNSKYAWTDFRRRAGGISELA
jgi:hypothetical protein